MSMIDNLSADAFIARLLAILPDEFDGDTQDALDMAVHDSASEDESIETFGEDDPDTVEDYRSRHASSINNQGTEEQLRYLIQMGFDSKDIVELFADDEGLSAHAKLALMEFGRNWEQVVATAN